MEKRTQIIVAEGESDWIKDLLHVVKKHVNAGTYKFSDHALEEMRNDSLDLRDVIRVLLHGWHDKSLGITPFPGKQLMAWMSALS
jgi:hypothetical protein